MNKVWRILDANLNRAAEGLRVIEEIARFALDDTALSAEAKFCRHYLTDIRRQPVFSYNMLVEARDAANDVSGAHIYSKTEGLRTNYQEIAVANIKRVQEAARVLEEFGKLIEPDLGHKFKRFRFRIYTLEKDLAEALQWWQWPEVDWTLYVITGDRWAKGRGLEETVTRAIEGGAGVIQLREKEMSARELVKVGRKIRVLTRQAGIAFIVNDRVDIALAVDADGVHVGQHDMDVTDVRKIVGLFKLVGVSTHSVDEAKRAAEAGANYIGVGPMFTTDTKRETPLPGGLQLLRDIRAAVQIPCIAIGGLKSGNVAEVIAAGAHGIAVVSAVIAADDIKAATKELLDKINVAKRRNQGSGD